MTRTRRSMSPRPSGGTEVREVRVPVVRRTGSAGRHSWLCPRHRGPGYLCVRERGSVLAFQLQGFYDARRSDIIQPDIARVGGISEARKITAMASAFDIPITLHVGLSGPGCRAESLQLAPILPRALSTNYEIYFLPKPLHTDIIDRPIERFGKGVPRSTERARPELGDKPEGDERVPGRASAG